MFLPSDEEYERSAGSFTLSGVPGLTPFSPAAIEAGKISCAMSVFPGSGRSGQDDRRHLSGCNGAVETDNRLKKTNEKLDRQVKACKSGLREAHARVETEIGRTADGEKLQRLEEQQTLS